MTARTLLLIGPLLTCACLEPPELEAWQPPPPDMAAGDTWPDLGSPGADEGPGAAEGPAENSGDGEESGQPDVPTDPALADLRITELLADPEGKDGGVDSPEFIEIQNAGSSAALLDGLVIDAPAWPLLDMGELGLAGVELGAGAVLIIRRWTDDAPAPAVELGEGLVASGFLGDAGLRNADGWVELRAGSELLDALAYGADPGRVEGWSGGAVEAGGSGESLCRVEPDDHDDMTDWSQCVPTAGDPTPSPLDDDGGGGGGDPEDPVPVEPGALVIVEVSANPPGPSSDEKYYEFIELINISENEVELTHCLVGDDPSVDAPGVDPLEHLSGDGGCASPTCLAPGRRALLVGQTYLGESNDALVLATDDTTLADGGLTNTEPVVLWDGLGTMVSSYRLWPDPAAPPLPSDEQPLHRLDPGAPDEPASWVSAPASPGLP